MKIIDKKSFIPTVCVVYTCLSVGKIVLEAFAQEKFGNDQRNFLVMLLFAFLGTLVLSQHYRLDKYPLTLVIVGQYVVLITGVMLFTWISSFFSEMHEDGYRDMFWTFTIPYAICAAVYYISLYFEIKKADRMLQEMKKES